MLGMLIVKDATGHCKTGLVADIIIEDTDTG